MALEEGVDLWEAKVKGKRVIPITQNNARAAAQVDNSGEPITVSLKFAPKPSTQEEVTVSLPRLGLRFCRMGRSPRQRLPTGFVRGA